MDTCTEAFGSLKVHFIEVEPGTFIGRGAACRGYFDYPLAPETLRHPTHLQELVLRAYTLMMRKKKGGENRK